MSIAEMQACLARLYLNDAYRHWFYADPAGALAGYRLEPEERDVLPRLPRDQLERFASSLIAKRRKDAEAAYPASFALNGEAMRRLYHRYHQLLPPRLDQPRTEDVIAFGRFAEASLRDDELIVAYANELVRYERLYYTACVDASGRSKVPGQVDDRLPSQAQPGIRRGVHLAHFDHDVAAVEEALRQGDPPPTASEVRGGCSILFVPGSNRREARMLRINAATVAVVERCDGQRTVAEVIAGTEAALSASGLREAIAETITRLVAAGALALDDERIEPDRRAYCVSTLSEAM
jgi:hypothetical protein